MKRYILSAIAAALVLATFAGCTNDNTGNGNVSSRMPNATVSAPNNNNGSVPNNNNNNGSGVVGDVVNGVENGVNDVVSGVENGVNDLLNGASSAVSGVESKLS